MTDKFKKRVREHAEKHGMSYQAARQQMETRDGPAAEPSPEKGLEPLISDEVFGARAMEISENLRDPGLRMSAMAELVVLRTRTRRQEIRTRHRHEETMRLSLLDDAARDDLRERRAKLEERCEVLDMMLEAVKAEVVAESRGGPVDPELLRALGWARVREPALAWKLPPPEDDTATEFPDEAFRAWWDHAHKLEEELENLRPWIARARALEDEVDQLRVQLAGVSVAASGHARGEHDVTPGMYGHSVPFEDVKALRNRHEEVLGLVGALWQLLDDVDTAGDMAKDDDAAYRRIVEKVQKRRWGTGVEAGEQHLYLRGWPSGRKHEKWLDRFDPATSTGHEVVDQIGPEILERGFDIVVNGREHHVMAVSVSFADVVDIVYPDGRPRGWEALTMTYSSRRSDGGILYKDSDPVRLEDGMIFSAMFTGNA